MKYIAYYGIPNTDKKRSMPLAAVNKISYIANVISKFDDVEIISASGTVDGNTLSTEKIQISENLTLKVFFSLGRENKVFNIIGHYLLYLQLAFYLVFNIKKDEKVIVYHSLGYMKLISFLHKFKRFKLIIEAEEIYADVMGNAKIRKKEMAFLQSAEGYICPTPILERKINIHNKPFVIIHGTYQVEEEKSDKIALESFQSCTDNKIHCVYAGTLDPRKGGAVATIEAAKYLPKNYRVHIIGFGNGKDLESTKKIINQINDISNAKVSYDGLFSGEEYVKFLQSCDIGLSTQNPNAAFNDTSFPSKILSYMANGLKVVSVRIPVVELSAVADEVEFYDNQTPQEIAEAIKKIDLTNQVDFREKIIELDKHFKEDISLLLSKI